MINQLLFGETMKVLEAGDTFWVKIKGVLDGYEGWVARGQLEPVHEITAFKRWPPIVMRPFTLLQVGNNSMIIPFGASLLGLAAQADLLALKGLSLTAALMYKHKKEPQSPSTAIPGSIGNFSYTYKEAAAQKVVSPGFEDIRALTGIWLDVPYLWGGRTLMGVDCSGFVQTAYKAMGFRIARDAHGQALQGQVVGFLQEAIAGDLAFFDDDEGKIIHVGILLNDHEIIHASGGAGKVRIDKIDNEGIVRSDTGARTHRLRIIKRGAFQPGVFLRSGSNQ